MRLLNRTLARRWPWILAVLFGLSAIGGCGGSTQSYTAGTAYWSVVAADFDGDGLTDIAGSYAADGEPPHPGYVAVFLRSASEPGRFLPSNVYAVGNDPFALTAGDFDGDGRIDLATYNAILATSGAGVNDVSVLLQVAAAPGRFESAISCYPAWLGPHAEPGSPLCAALRLPDDFRVNTVHTDLNGDGLADQVVAHFGSLSPGCEAFNCNVVDARVSVALQDPGSPGGYLAPIDYPSADSGFVTWVVAADIDGDGRPDLVIGQSNGLYIRYQDPSHPGQFTDPVLVDR